MIYRNRGYGPIDRFCAKHPNFGIPNLMKIIVFGQIAVYLVNMLVYVMFKQSFLSYLQFVPAYILQGQVWRLVTWVVVPNASSPFMLLLTCYFYYWIAVMLEREWGTARFTLFYLSGMVLSVVIGMLVGLAGVAQINPYYLLYPMNLSYYLNLSIFLVLSVLYGEMQVLLFFMVPVKMKWMALIDVVLVIVDMAGFVQSGLWMLALVPLASFINGPGASGQLYQLLHFHLALLAGEAGNCAPQDRPQGDPLQAGPETGPGDEGVSPQVRGVRYHRRRRPGHGVPLLLQVRRLLLLLRQSHQQPRAHSQKLIVCMSSGRTAEERPSAARPLVFCAKFRYTKENQNG